MDNSYTVNVDFIATYPEGWRAFQLHFNTKPKGFREWLRFAWGWDIFYFSFPFLKSLLLANFFVWWLLWIN